MQSCTYCSHIVVCSMYDALIDAVIKIDTFNEVNQDYEDKMLEVLAENCRQFREI